MSLLLEPYCADSLREMNKTREEIAESVASAVIVRFSVSVVVRKCTRFCTHHVKDPASKAIGFNSLIVSCFESVGFKRQHAPPTSR